MFWPSPVKTKQGGGGEKRPERREDLQIWSVNTASVTKADITEEKWWLMVHRLVSGLSASIKENSLVCLLMVSVEAPDEETL